MVSRHVAGSLPAQARKNFASFIRVSRQSPRPHAGMGSSNFREKKEPSVSGRLKNFYANTTTCTTVYTR